jgi:5'-3' exonuclease
MYNTKFREEYGQMVVACDGGSWRKDVFPEYKANRAKARDSSGMDWSAFFNTLTKVREEIGANLPWIPLHMRGVEADDIIACLVQETQEFGKNEKVMIVSADKDFIQLHKYKNVKQFSPMKKKLITEKDPIRYIKEHIFRGDSSDGVPNVLSADSVFIDEGTRQTPLSKKKINEWLENYDSLSTIMPEHVYRNFQRNQKVIDLDFIPEDIKSEILDIYNKTKPAPKMKVLNYLITNRLSNLVPSASDFFPHE